MSDAFREVVIALKETADGLILANQGIKKAADAVLAARDEHGDLRETVQRLESLIMAQSREIRALRERLNGGDAA
jgi:hypothetical protein